MKNKIKKLLCVLICIFAAAELTVNSAEVSGYVTLGLNMCANVVLPSLFPFVFLSLFIAESGAAEISGRALRPVVNKILGLPGCAGAVIVLSLLGGYTAGAQAAASLYKNGKITNAQFNKLMGFCVCASPSFLIEFYGAYCFKSITAGCILLISQIVSFFIMSVFVCRLNFFKNQSENKNKNFNENKNKNIFTWCIYNASNTIMSICACVVIFTVIAGILNNLPLNLNFNIISALLESCSGSSDAAKEGLIFASFACSFAGVCVHFQIFSICGECPLNKRMFVFFRLTAGALSAVITFFITKFFNFCIPAASVGKNIYLRCPSPYGSAALILMCFAAVVILPEKNNFKNINA